MHSHFFSDEKNEEDLLVQPEMLWAAASLELKTELGEATFDLWLADFELLSVSASEVVLQAPGAMYSIWVEENFKDSLLVTFKKYLPHCQRVSFQVVAQEESGAKGAKSARGRKDLERDGAAAVELAAEAKPASKSIKHVISEEKLLQRGRESGLVEIYRFENFVPGENSELAYAASRAVAEQPGKTYQPLFFHSSCGLGKTHLLHAIGWDSLRRRPKSKVLYVTAEQFANDYIDAIQKNSLVGFRKKYRETDLLLIDDVQFLGRKEGLQREFFHTFNRLADQRKQVVLASDCPASEITELEERLLSRFQWGLSVAIHRPGLETRAAILRRKRDDWGMAVSDELINAIVERVQGNVRLLEGALIRVAMVVNMNEERVTVESMDEILSDICGGAESRQVSLHEIKRAVAEQYDLDEAVLNGKKRTARVAEARQVAMYLIRQMTDLSLVEVAASFGKDHGTVIYAVKKIKARCESSASLKSTVELIKRRLLRGGTPASSNRSRVTAKMPAHFRMEGLKGRSVDEFS